MGRYSMHVQWNIGMGAKRKQEAHIRHIILYNRPSSYAHHQRLLGRAIEGDRLERLLFPMRTCSNLPVISAMSRVSATSGACATSGTSTAITRPNMPVISAILTLSFLAFFRTSYLLSFSSHPGETPAPSLPGAPAYPAPWLKLSGSMFDPLIASTSRFLVSGWRMLSLSSSKSSASRNMASNLWRLGPTLRTLTQWGSVAIVLPMGSCGAAIQCGGAPPKGTLLTVAGTSFELVSRASSSRAMMDRANSRETERLSLVVLRP
jgi:hypothetical protein